MAVAGDAGKDDAVKIEDGGGHGVRDQEAQQAVLNDRVRSILMQRERQFGIQIGFAQFLFFVFLRFGGRPERRKIAQRRRDIVLVRVAHLNAGILLRCLLLLSRCEKSGPEQSQKNAGGKKKKCE
jgi:hypothetical protein